MIEEAIARHGAVHVDTIQDALAKIAPSWTSLSFIAQDLITHLAAEGFCADDCVPVLSDCYRLTPTANRRLGKGPTSSGALTTWVTISQCGPSAEDETRYRSGRDEQRSCE